MIKVWILEPARGSFIDTSSHIGTFAERSIAIKTLASIGDRMKYLRDNIIYFGLGSCVLKPMQVITAGTRHLGYKEDGLEIT